MIKVHSFDVFDTCLTREVAAPSDVFFFVAQKAFDKLGIPANRARIEDFVAARISAESTARRQTAQEDVSLGEIWRRLIQTMGWPQDKLLDQCELDAEEELLSPILVIREQVLAAREQGPKIVFVSDMYLPSEFIERQLIKHGFMVSGDAIYVSGDIGKAKSTGNLFRHLLANENVCAAEVWHTGNNHHSDYVVPLNLGMRADHFSDSQFGGVEKQLVEWRPLNGEKWLHTAGKLRAGRLGSKTDISTIAAAKLVHSFIGPFLCLFSYWLLARAKRDGVATLYFASRDARLLWSVCRALASLRHKLKVDCRYLQISRQALLLPSASDVSKEGMPWMQRSFESATLPRLLSKLEIDYEKFLVDWLKIYSEWASEKVLDADEHWRHFWGLLQRPDWLSVVRQRIDYRRACAQAYFHAQGLMDGSPSALVDLGWFLTGQTAIKAICEPLSSKLRLRGYYLNLKQSRVSPLYAGEADAIFFEPPNDISLPSGLNWFGKRETVLEHVVGLADHPRVSAYELGGVVKYAHQAITESHSALFRAIEAELFVYVQNVGESWREMAEDDDAIREVLSKLIMNFVLHPDTSVCEILRDVPVASDQNDLDVHAMIESKTLREIVFEIMPASFQLFFNYQARKDVWTEASWQVTPPARRWIAAQGKALRAIYKSLRNGGSYSGHLTL